jgi:proteasome lid subunit RPN8/RPN11
MIERISDSVVDAVVADAAAWGRRGVETGGFVLATAEGGAGDVFAVCGTHGIVRRPDQLIISGEALAALFDYASDRGLIVVCQVHSHQHGARMSPVDQRFGLTVEGFTSAIVPRWASPPSDPADWGWWRFADGRWSLTAAPETVEANSGRLVFDKQGVRDA